MIDRAMVDTVYSRDTMTTALYTREAMAHVEVIRHMQLMMFYHVLPMKRGVFPITNLVNYPRISSLRSPKSSNEKTMQKWKVGKLMLM